MLSLDSAAKSTEAVCNPRSVVPLAMFIRISWNQTKKLNFSEGTPDLAFLLWFLWASPFIALENVISGSYFYSLLEKCQISTMFINVTLDWPWPVANGHIQSALMSLCYTGHFLWFREISQRSFTVTCEKTGVAESQNHAVVRWVSPMSTTMISRCWPPRWYLPGMPSGCPVYLTHEDHHAMQVKDIW